jgi:cysteine-rich repeat protein
MTQRVRPTFHGVGAAVVSVCFVALSGTVATGQDYQRLSLGEDRNPHVAVVLPGPPTNTNGICDDTIVAGGDDAVLVSGGRSLPHQIAVAPGRNGALETVRAGDDEAATAICAGADGLIDSVRNPADDVLPVDDPLCDLLCGNDRACVLPGADRVLQTPVDGRDVAAPFLLSGADGIAQSQAGGDDVQKIAVGTGFPDTVCVEAGANGIAETTVCGNGVADFEETGDLNDDDCDDGNLVDADGCDSNCTVTACGNGIRTTPEECDDGNRQNDDACVAGCLTAVCGDGFRQSGVEECEPPNTPTCDATCRRVPLPCGNGTLEPGEQCDDGNHSNRDDCPGTCETARCGDGFRHDKGTPPFEECDDGGIAPGDGCSTTCMLECGNGVIEGSCSEPAASVGRSCLVGADCDVTPGDGICVYFEECDPGAPGLCLPGPAACSDSCLILDCGNGVKECDEECDLGGLNGEPGSGCLADCRRDDTDRPGRRECLHVWSVNGLPQRPRERNQICVDGEPCDGDAVPGQCTFRVGACLNRSGLGDCTPGGLVTYELRRMDIEDVEQAAFVESMTAGVAALAPGAAIIPDRCRLGLREKTCAIPSDHQCDRAFGLGDGACDIGTGVLFTSPFDDLDTCTDTVDVVLPTFTRAKLRARVTRGSSRERDDDLLRLVCRPSD